MNTIIEKFLFGRGYWYLPRHLFFWIGIYLDEILYTVISSYGTEDLDTFFIAVVIDALMVYVNLYVLIPRFFETKKYSSYFVLSILTVAINVALIYTYNKNLFEYELALDDFVSWFITNGTVLATAVALKIGKYYYEQGRLTERLKLDQSKLELNYLKQQVNPHFLFNVLNTIHIQSKTEPTSVSETVLQLSDMLRYQIYDAGASDKVPLLKEIEFLKNYTALEKVRRTNIEVNWEITSELPKVKITPFLFLPLIENAFKHSRSASEKETIIDIYWNYEKNMLVLQVNNTIGDLNEKEGGFGIDNLKKRLELLYPNTYQLNLRIKDGKFISKLEIEIDEGRNH